MQKTKDLLKLWCLGFGIESEVIDNPAVSLMIKEKDGVDAWRAFMCHFKYIDPSKPETLGPREQLEFIGIVNG